MSIDRWAERPLAWTMAGEMRVLATDAALLLLVGGLAMLTLIIALVVLQSFIPEKPPAARQASPPNGRELRPLQGSPRPGPSPAARWRRGGPRRRPALRVDSALERVLERGQGEPRLLQSRPHRARVRLYRCRDCLETTGLGDASAAIGCPASEDAIDEAFRRVFGSAVDVRETRCRRRGSPECEFEVHL